VAAAAAAGGTTAPLLPSAAHLQAYHVNAVAAEAKALGVLPLEGEEVAAAARTKSTAALPRATTEWLDAQRAAFCAKALDLITPPPAGASSSAPRRRSARAVDALAPADVQDLPLWQVQLR